MAAYAQVFGVVLLLRGHLLSARGAPGERAAKRYVASSRPTVMLALQRDLGDMFARERLMPAPGRACCRSVYFGGAMRVSTRRAMFDLQQRRVAPDRRRRAPLATLGLR